MNSPDYEHRHLALLAGSIILPQVPSLLTLAPNQIKRLFRSKNQYEVCGAISFASTICTKEISIYIEDDLGLLLNHSKACIRRRGCALAKRVVLNHFSIGSKVAQMLKNVLSDSDENVKIAGTCAVLDCAVVYPHLFLQTIPSLYNFLEGKNIRLSIKALQALCLFLNCEKRLYKKLEDKLLDILNKVKAMSLEVEIHKQIARHFPNTPKLIEKTKDQIIKYLSDTDANIRYMGLLILKPLLESHKNILPLYKDKLIQMLSTEDKPTKIRVLDIISECVYLYIII